MIALWIDWCARNRFLACTIGLVFEAIRIFARALRFLSCALRFLPRAVCFLSRAVRIDDASVRGVLRRQHGCVAFARGLGDAPLGALLHCGNRGVSLTVRLGHPSICAELGGGDRRDPFGARVSALCFEL